MLYFSNNIVFLFLVFLFVSCTSVTSFMLIMIVKFGNFYFKSNWPANWAIPTYMECWLGSFVICQGIQTSIPEETYC